MKNGIELLCTLGPASMNEHVIRRLEAYGATLFRINLSHTKLEDVRERIKFIQSFSNVPVCLDSEGAQVRTGPIKGGAVRLMENHIITAHAEAILGDKDNFSLYPGYIIDALEEGDLITVDFNGLMVQVMQADKKTAQLRVLNGGNMGSNKAVTVQKLLHLPPLTEKDVAAIKIGLEEGVTNFALSFANRPADVEEMRRHTGEGARIISKIECHNGLIHLDEITRLSDAILIDRGDLSREVPVERIPLAQKMIISRAKAQGRKVYVATNLLESMIESPLPTRAEVNDIYTTLSDGADGLVLAAETAIGKHPLASAAMIVKMSGEFNSTPTLEHLLKPGMNHSLLAEPHGGELVRRIHESMTSKDVEGLQQIKIDTDILSDVRQIAVGTYSPLTGFMDRETLESVLDNYALPNGVKWSMPIILPVQEEDARSLSKGYYRLTDPSGKSVAVMEVSDIYRPDIDSVAQRWFGTLSADHPGVARLKKLGPVYLGGNIKLLADVKTQQGSYDLPPAKLRQLFAYKGWNRVVGFHSRNVAHRAHEAVQLAALEKSCADGLLISPVIGTRKKGDFLPEVILDCYQAMLDKGIYPENKAVLASFSTYARYSGPREAVFTTLCRKNMGCSHMVIGRDHTGVGNFYEPYAAHRLLEKMGDIGITPVFFEAMGYHAESGLYRTEEEGIKTLSISGTQIRQAINENTEIPEWAIRDIVQEVIRRRIADKLEVFAA